LIENISQVKDGIDEADFWRHRKKNGDIIDVTISSHELLFAGGRAKIVLATDITERKKAEDSIRFQAHLLNTVEQAVIATNLEGTVIYWNQFAEKLYGWTDVEAINRNIKELTTPEINAAQADQIMSDLNTGKSWTGEFTVRNKAGAFFPAHVSNSPVTDNNGELMGIVGISVDISERKKAEEQIRKADIRALIEYEKLLERIGSLAEALGTARELLTIYMALRSFALETTPCSGIFVSLFDPERQVRLPSYAFSEGEEIDLSGLPPMPMNDSPHSRAVATGQAIITDDFQAETKGLPVVNVGLERNPALPQSSLVTPMSIMGRVIGAVEIQSIRKAAFGKEHITAMRMAANLIANAIENVRLIDQEREKEEQLRLSQKLESVGRMAGGIAHDFNNMLTAINGYSELTLRRLEPANPLRGNIEEIKKAGERSAALTQQLLAFSRRQVLKPKIISFNEVVLDISKMLRHLIGEDMHLSIVPFSELGLVEADPGQLTQVIMNLAINARDAMPSGGNLTIETSNVYLDEEYAKNHAPTQPGSYVLLSVSDCGTGMSEHVKQHIFEPFYTTKETGRGTGLGLATVYGIIKQSGGYIWVDSEEDVGTTFKIYLPRVDTESALAPEEKAAPETESKRFPSASRKI
jgi:PAS domain S-box-containing protein